MEIKLIDIVMEDLKASGELDSEDQLHTWRGKIFVNIGDNAPHMFVAYGKNEAHVYSFLGSDISKFRDGCRAMDAPKNVLAFLQELTLNCYERSNSIVMKGDHNG